MEKINLIAEIGVNHNSNKKLGKELIKQAKKIGASSVKFKLLKQNISIKKHSKVPIKKTIKSLIMKC